MYKKGEADFVSVGIQYILVCATLFICVLHLASHCETALHQGDAAFLDYTIVVRDGIRITKQQGSIHETAYKM